MDIKLKLSLIALTALTSLLSTSLGFTYAHPKDATNRSDNKTSEVKLAGIYLKNGSVKGPVNTKPLKDWIDDLNTMKWNDGSQTQSSHSSSSNGISRPGSNSHMSLPQHK